MGIITTLKRLILGSTVIGWVRNALDKALTKSADKVAAKYGAEAKQFVLDAEAVEEAPLSNPEKLFKVAADIIAVAAKDGWTVPFLIAIIVAQRVFAQVKEDALTEVNAFLAAVSAHEAN